MSYVIVVSMQWIFAERRRGRSRWRVGEHESDREGVWDSRK